jgi:SAM-dependent methyltransferase
MATAAYFWRSLASQFTTKRFRCPSCGGVPCTVIDRKYLLTQLRRCGDCKLMFRTPTDDPTTNLPFYENEYTQGFTTDLPAVAALTEMTEMNFAGTEKCYRYYISVLSQLGFKPRNRVFDYGCSWGYGSYQLTQAGFEVLSFDVAPSRRRYAHENLSVRTVDDMDRATDDFSGYFDCFFSAHVLEHVPSPAQSFEYALRLLKPKGLVVCFTPNGSEANRAITPNWSKHWGEVHPNFIDDIFLDNSFKLSPRSVGSSPVTNASLPERCQLKRLNKLDGSELFFAARKCGDIWG